MRDVISVASYSELVRDDHLDIHQADAIASALGATSSTAADVVFLPRPLAEEKVLESEDGTDCVFVVDLDGDRETGDAYYARQGRRTAWLPKSTTRIYVESEGADIHIPESGHEQEGSA